MLTILLSLFMVVAGGRAGHFHVSPYTHAYQQSHLRSLGFQPSLQLTAGARPTIRAYPMIAPAHAGSVRSIQAFPMRHALRTIPVYVNPQQATFATPQTFRTAPVFSQYIQGAHFLPREVNTQMVTIPKKRIDPVATADRHAVRVSAVSPVFYRTADNYHSDGDNDNRKLRMNLGHTSNIRSNYEVEIDGDDDDDRELYYRNVDPISNIRSNYEVEIDHDDDDTDLYRSVEPISNIRSNYEVEIDHDDDDDRELYYRNAEQTRNIRSNYEVEIDGDDDDRELYRNVGPITRRMRSIFEAGVDHDDDHVIVLKDIDAPTFRRVDDNSKLYINDPTSKVRSNYKVDVDHDDDHVIVLNDIDATKFRNVADNSRLHINVGPASKVRSNYEADIDNEDDHIIVLKNVNVPPFARDGNFN